MKKFLIVFSLIAVGALGYTAYRFVSKGNAIAPIKLVPSDAYYIIETDNPIASWHAFSKSAVWQHLKKNALFGDISKNADQLDSVITKNETLFSLVGTRNLIISAHPLKNGATDYLFIVDLQKISRVNLTLDQIDNVFRIMGYSVKKRQVHDHYLREISYPRSKQVLYLSFLGDQLLCAYSESIVENAINQSDNPAFATDVRFKEIDDRTEMGTAKIFINYASFKNFLKPYTDAQNTLIPELCRDMLYTALKMTVNDQRVEWKGNSSVQDTVNSYLRALLRSGHNEVSAQKVLSQRTAFFMDLGFSHSTEYFENLNQVFSRSGSQYQAYQDMQNRLQSYLKIDVQKNFISWMSGEVAFAQNEPSGLGHVNEFVVAIKTNNIKNATDNLAIVARQIRRKTPVKFKQINYKGYVINYLHINGLFKMLFGKFFEKLQKPYYTVIDDYVILSNSTETLLGLIEDYRTHKTLENQPEFREFQREFSGTSTVYAYMNSVKLFPLLKNFSSEETYQKLQANKDFVVCFSPVGFQMSSDNDLFSTHILMNFRQPAAAMPLDTMHADTGLAGRRTDTLSEVQRFYIEKLQGNVDRQYFESGKIKSEVEMKAGMRNGRYKLYSEAGALVVAGHFKNGLKEGKWKYFDTAGNVVRKQRFIKGDSLSDF